MSSYKVKLKKDINEPGLIGVDVLPKYISEYKDQVIPFDNETDFQSFLKETGTTELDYEDIDGPSGGGGSDLSGGKNINIRDKTINTNDDMLVTTISSINSVGNRSIEITPESLSIMDTRTKKPIKVSLTEDDLDFNGFKVKDRILMNAGSVTTANEKIITIQGINTGQTEDINNLIKEAESLNTSLSSLIAKTETLTTEVEFIIEKDAKQPVIKGEYNRLDIYDKNDIVFQSSLGRTFISLKDKNTSALSDVTSWFQQKAVGVDVDLSNYYTIIQTQEELKKKMNNFSVSSNLLLSSNILSISPSFIKKVEDNKVDIAKHDVLLQNLEDNKQAVLTPGPGITITGDTISASGGGTTGGGSSTFKSGQKVENVDYLCLENKDALDDKVDKRSNNFIVGNNEFIGNVSFGRNAEFTGAVYMSAPLFMNGGSIQKLIDPVNSDDAANKKYVDAKLLLKADKSAIDTINVELGVQSTNITQNTNDILLKASQVALDQLTAAVGTQLNTKQAKLVAGANITINPTTNEISSTGGNTTFKSGEKVDEVDYLGVINRDNILNKQNKLIAGTNITITGDTISASGGSTPDSALTSKTNTFNFRQIIKSAGTGLLDLQNATSSVLNITYVLATTSVNITAPNTLTMKFGAKDYDFSGKELKNIGNPTDGNSAVNKSYIDNRNFATVGQLNLKADETYVDDKVKNMDTLYKRANTSIPSVIVAGDSTSTISTIFDSATWNLISGSNQYYLLAYTNSVASRTRFPMVIRMEYAMTSNDYNVHTGAGDFTFFNYTNFGTTYSIKLMVALSRNNGAFRFAASFNGTLNANFTINRVEIWKKASL